MKNILNTKVGRLAIAGVVAAGAVVGISIAANGAAVKPDCKNLMYPLCPRSVAATQVVDNSLPASKIAPADRAAFLKDTNTPDVKGTGTKIACDTKVIAKIGGPFASNSTKVCDFQLPAGKYLLNTTAFFARTVAGAAGTRPQLALRVDGSGADAGTILGAEISPSKDRELTGSATKMVGGGVTINVIAFGYNDNGSAAGGGEITVAPEIDIVRVG